ncbi:hypothetical protein LJC59_07495 [Desulfovibrio sp. OttesenSCG-928-A18]|nr:hypothetical protein [Desulfovibrio sp. OttesenSCG-928-A18]
MPFQDPGSFRDPSGHVYHDDGRVLRTINEFYREDWEAADRSGLLGVLKEKGQLVGYREIQALQGSWKTLDVDVIPWLSYPYEWSFAQLKDAALLTLAIQKEALARGMVLKDASAYNVQFYGTRPVFIDLLSFEIREPTAPWQAYRQFCMHFLAPLAVGYYEPRLSRLSALWIDGIPLDIAWNMLPGRAALSGGLQMHLNLHAKAERKYSDARTAAGKIKNVKLSTQSLLDLADSLVRTVQSLAAAQKTGEWTDYYSDTNYTETAEQAKRDIVARAAAQYGGDKGVAIDLGANTGRYSTILADSFPQVIAADIDAQAVSEHYMRLKKDGNTKILPLVLDLANPSPGIGWACRERASWVRRGKANLISALALSHHLYFTNGIPWSKQAAFFAETLRDSGTLILEFVPAGDSQVERLLAARDNIFTDYSPEGLLSAFAPFFLLQEVVPLPESSREMFIFSKK